MSGNDAHSYASPPETDNRRAVNVRIRAAMRETVQALMRLGSHERWPRNRLPQVHKALIKAERSLPEGERLFSSKSDLGRLNPGTLTGWGKLIGFPDRSVSKYLQPKFHPKFTVQSHHIKRLHLILRELKIFTYEGAEHPAFYKTPDSWSRFLTEALHAIRARSDQRSKETHDRSFDNAENDFPGVPREQRSEDLAQQIPTADPLDALILDDPRIAGKHQRYAVNLVQGLWANVEIDRFRERTTDMEFLGRFLSPEKSEKLLPDFRWALVTGAAGDGKTRLALEFFKKAEMLQFRFGFLSFSNLKNFHSRVWRPSRPTFIVVDYAAEEPNLVADLLKGLAARTYDPGFEFPVRVLLLERDAASNWLKKLMSPDTAGNSIRALCYRATEDQLEYRLTTLSLEALLKIMRDRVADNGVGDVLLLETLLRVDPHWRAIGEDWQLLPRPLFAAATAQAIAELLKDGDEALDVVRKLEKEDVLSRLIDRERIHFWGDALATDHLLEKRRLGLHENLLLISTMTLDLPRRELEKIGQEVLKYLPDQDSFDEDRLRRMSGADVRSAIKRLEPDVVGEYFVLKRLDELNEHERQALINAGLTLGGSRSSIFLIRCATDFAELWRKLDFLQPSTSGPASIAFVKAAAHLPTILDESRSDDVSAVIKAVLSLADKTNDPSLAEHIALALYNYGVRLGETRPEAAIGCYDELIVRYGASNEPILREHIATALLNKGVLLGALGHHHEALAVYDDLLNQFADATHPSICDCFHRSIINKGHALIAIGQAQEAISMFDQFIRLYGDSTERNQRERTIMALTNKASALGNMLHKVEEASNMFDDLIDRFGAASEPEFQRHLAVALLSKARIFAAHGQQPEAIATWTELASRYSSTNDVEVRMFVAQGLLSKAKVFLSLNRKLEALTELNCVIEILGASTDSEPQHMSSTATAIIGTKGSYGLVARALGDKGAVLGMLERHGEAIDCLNQVVDRYRNSEEIELRTLVAHSLVNKGVALCKLGQEDHAINIFDEVIIRYGACKESGLLTEVSRAQALKQRFSPQD
jgi:tetratricopeptide (TPR) repeat protein